MTQDDDLMYLPEEEKDGTEIFDTTGTAFKSVGEINLDDIRDAMSIKMTIKEKRELVKKMPSKDDRNDELF